MSDEIHIPGASSSDIDLRKNLLDNLTDFAKAVVGVLPAGSLAALIVDKIHESQYDRTVKAVYELRERVNELQEIKVSRDEFEFLLERYTAHFAKPNTDETRLAFQDALVGTLATGDVDYQEQKDFIRLIDEFPTCIVDAIVVLYEIHCDLSWQPTALAARPIASMHTFLDDYGKSHSIDIDSMFTEEVVHILKREFLVQYYIDNWRTMATSSGAMQGLATLLTEKGARIAAIIKAGRDQRMTT